jgi:predicted ribosomally synthesized peptide with SipW-like signal peptide
MLRTDSTRLSEKFFGPMGIRVRAILALGIVLGLGAVGTFALWSNSALATSGDFHTGVVDLQVNGSNNYVFSGATMAEMLPGDSRAATLQVQNTLSSLPVSYTMAASTATGSPALTNYLQMTVFASASPTNTSSGGLTTGHCAGTQLGSATLRAANSVPVIIAAQSLTAAAGSTGNPSSQDLCIIVALAANAPLDVQGQTLSAITLTFTATTT